MPYYSKEHGLSNHPIEAIPVLCCSQCGSTRYVSLIYPPTGWVLACKQDGFPEDRAFCCQKHFDTFYNKGNQ